MPPVKLQTTVTRLVLAVLALAAWMSNVRAEDVHTIDGQIFIRTAGGDNVKLSLVKVAIFDSKPIEENLENKRKVAAPLLEYLQPRKERASAAAAAAEAVRKQADDAAQAAVGDADFYTILATSSNAGITALETSRDAGRIVGQANYLISAMYYFADLPAPLNTTKTDADGKFTFKVPNGSYVLVASSSRSAAGDTEWYNWMVKVTVNADVTVMLANDNVSTSGSPDSMVRTLEDLGPMPPIGTLAGSDSINLLGQYATGNQPDRFNILAAMLDMQNGGLQKLTAAVRQQQEQERQRELQSFRDDPQAAQRTAIQLFPDLAVAGSPLNKEFIARMKRYQSDKKDFFADPDWPIRLAKECAEVLNPSPPKQ